MILPRAALTPSGRPQLVTGEVERVLLDKVDIEWDGVGATEGCQAADRYKEGYAVVTSHRLLWIDAAAQPGRSCELALGSLAGVAKRVQYGLNLMAPKVRLELKVYVDAQSKPTHMAGSLAFRYCSLRCRGESPDAFQEQLSSALAAARLRAEQAAQQQGGQPPPQMHAWSAAAAGAGAGAGAGSDSGPLTTALAAGQRAGSRTGQPQQEQQQWQAPTVAAVDIDMLNGLLDMGFARPRVLRALLATGSESTAAALDWVLAAEADPATAQPLPGPEPAAVSRGELQRLCAMQQQPAGSSLLPGWGLGSVSAAQGALVGPPGGQQPAAPDQPPARPSSRVVGVAGIMSREAEKTSQASASLAVAFQDLDALMAMASEMVQLAERFRGVMGADGAITLGQPGPAASGAAQQAAAAPGDTLGSGGSELLLDADTQLQLIAMGIASPVTKASAGARYTQELSRQLADFLAAPLAKAGGVLLLPDVYCLFNRARGTELVSPDDLLQACEAFAPLNLPLRLRRFASGVTVVQGAQFSDAQLSRRIEQLLAARADHTVVRGGGSAFVPGLGPALSAADVSSALSLPLTLAREALLVAEGAGVLCRDDGPEGLRFFRNFFAQAQPLRV